MKITRKIRVVIHNLKKMRNKIIHVSQRIVTTFKYIAGFVRILCECSLKQQKICLVCGITVFFILVQLYIFMKEDFFLPSINLPSAEDEINPLKPNIFFVVAEDKLTSAQACSIESAAFSHPWISVHVLFNAPGPLKETTELRVLRSYKNIKLTRMDYHKLAEGTPIEKLRPIDKTDVLKILTMNKFGGIYLDLDVLVVKSFNGLSDDFVVGVGNNIFTFGVVGITTPKFRKTFVNYMLSDLLKIYKNNFEDIGDDVLKTSLGTYCTTSYPPEMSSETCPGLEIYRSQFMFRKSDQQKYFQNTLFYRSDDEIRAVSMKSDPSHPVSHLIKTYYPAMAARYCPKIFKHCKF